jgi:hypothetical protein
MMHNDLAEEIADRMKDAGCRDVMLEPDLLPVDGEAFELKTANKQDDARSDIRAEGFWGKKRRAFFDVMVFTPFARSYSTRSLKAIYAEHEGRKNREYKERILKVERVDFTPLVFSLTGGMGPQAQAVIRRLGGLLAEREKVSKSDIMGWLRVVVHSPARCYHMPAWVSEPELQSLYRGGGACHERGSPLPRPSGVRRTHTPSPQDS